MIRKKMKTSSTNVLGSFTDKLESLSYFDEFRFSEKVASYIRESNHLKYSFLDNYAKVLKYRVENNYRIDVNALCELNNLTHTKVGEKNTKRMNINMFFVFGAYEAKHFGEKAHTSLLCT